MAHIIPMLQAFLERIEVSIYRFFHRHFSGKYWDWKFSAALLVIIWLASFPSYQYFISPEPSVAENWKALEMQFQQPFKTPVSDPDQHFVQARFRILLPVISSYLGISPFFWILVLPLAGLVFIRQLIAGFYSLTKSKKISALIATGLASTYLVRAFTTDVMGYFDGYAYLLILLALFSRSSFAVFITCFAAFFVDERSILASPLIVFFIWITRESNLQLDQRLLRLEKPILPIFGAYALSLLLRYFISMQTGFGSFLPDSDLVGFQVIQGNYQVMPLLWLSGIGFFWISLCIPALYLFFEGRLLPGFLYLLYLVSMFALVLTVLDVTRSITYLFPGIMVGHLLVFKMESLTFFKRYLLSLTISSFLLPPLFAIGTTIVWQGPVFPKILKIMNQLSL